MTAADSSGLLAFALWKRDIQSPPGLLNVGAESRNVGACVMRKSLCIFLVVQAVYNASCSSDKKNETVRPSSADLSLTDQLLRCDEILKDENDQKTASALAEVFDAEAKCSSLLPHLKAATDLRLYHRDLKSIRLLNFAGNLNLLYLNFNAVDDLTPIKNHPNLILLDLEGNQLKDLKSLGSLPRLEMLRVTENKISSFDGIGEFPKLSILIARRNQIVDVSSIAGVMPKLMELGATENPLGTTVLKTEANCPTQDGDIPKGLFDFCKE
jgi:Leucine-rich repeat (LRR) protein